ncbi:MAG TPA: hypothetical protein VM619_04100 [Luteimonas sp.]|nr:hypothetical protein [Luteimonas sp.]
MTEYERCCVDGCNRRARRWSRYCEHHFERARTTGGATGRIIRKQELKPYREIAREWVDRNAGHPSVVAAVDWLRELVSEQEGARFLAGEMARLRNGTDPRAMLAAAIALWLQEDLSPRALNDDRVFDTNMGRALLRCAPRPVKSVAPSGRKEQTRTTASHARALGEHVRQSLGALPLVAAKAIRDEVLGPERTAATIREGLAVPFAPAE